MKYSVRMTETAKQDIIDISLYIFTLTKNRDTAKRYSAELRERCRTLRDFPYSGALPRDEILRESGFRYIMYNDKYLIFYKVDEPDKSVYIYSVFNAKADYTRVMRDFL